MEGMEWGVWPIWVEWRYKEANIQAYWYKCYVTCINEMNRMNGMRDMTSELN